MIKKIASPLKKTSRFNVSKYPNCTLIHNHLLNIGTLIIFLFFLNACHVLPPQQVEIRRVEKRRISTPRQRQLDAELIHPSWGFSTHSALTRMGSKLKTDTILNDETTEVERDLCAFVPIEGECPSSYLIALPDGGMSHNGDCDVSKQRRIAYIKTTSVRSSDVIDTFVGYAILR